MNLDALLDTRKSTPGLRRSARREVYWEMWAGIDPDYLTSLDKPPQHVQSALEEVMGPERMKNLKLRLHPLLKRWTLFQRRWDPETGKTNCWSPVSIFMDAPKEGVLPKDLENKGIDHLAGAIGEWRMPHKRDFVLIEECDKKKYPVEERCKGYAEQEDKRERDEASNYESFSHDFLSYNWWLAMQDAQAHYSKPWSTATVETKMNPDRYYILERSTEDGKKYKVRISKVSAQAEIGKEHQEMLKKEEMARDVHDEKKAQEMHELSEWLERQNKEEKVQRITYKPNGEVIKELVESDKVLV